MANAIRGEAELVIGGKPHLLRPTFTALIAAEEDLGPLFALAQRAGEGQLRLSEMTALFWHCLEQPGQAPNPVTRDDVGNAVMEAGLAKCATPLRALLGAILQGQG